MQPVRPVPLAPQVRKGHKVFRVRWALRVLPGRLEPPERKALPVPLGPMVRRV